MSITPLDPATAGPAELDDCFSVKLAASAADLPNDPRPTRESTIGQLTAPSPPDQRRCRWAARDGDRIVGTALVVLLGRENSDAAFIDVTVHPDHRRRGLGTALLREMVAAAAGRQTLLMEGLPEGGAGEAWADAHGFAVGLRTVRLSLHLPGADRSRWVTGAAAGYRLARWQGVIPEEFLASYATARNAMHDAPQADMKYTMPQWTPERLREAEASARAQHCQTLIVAAIDETTAEVAGLTELEIYQRRPDIAFQQDTSVLSAHRGRRLGLSMKSENLRMLAAQFGDVELVRTGTATGNEHMLRVNRQLGFEVDTTTQIRQVPLAELAARLAG